MKRRHEEKVCSNNDEMSVPAIKIEWGDEKLGDMVPFFTSTTHFDAGS